MRDLRREVYKGYALAYCHNCNDFHKDGIWSDSASTAARKHARETGHLVTVRWEQTVEYRLRTATR